MIRAARLLEHRRALGAIAKSAVGSWSERVGLTLVLEDDAGHQGLGEAAPLPGFSPDELPEARSALARLLGTAFPEHSSRDLLPALSDAARPLRSASARMALETALLDVWARQAGVPAWALLRPQGGEVPAELLLSLWLPQSLAGALQEAHGALARGVRSFKVKLDGGDAADPGLSILEALRSNLGAEVELRADANRSFTREGVRALAPRLAELGVVWLEEPTADALGPGLGVPIALDESLVTGPPSVQQLRAAGVAALVLKPTLLGGLSPCLRLASSALSAGIPSVVSHTLEGPLAYAGAAALALALGPGRPADGLAPHSGLGENRPPCLHGSADRLIPWGNPGLGLTLAHALAGTTSVEEVRA